MQYVIFQIECLIDKLISKNLKPINLNNVGQDDC